MKVALRERPEVAVLRPIRPTLRSSSRKSRCPTQRGRGVGLHDGQKLRAITVRSGAHRVLMPNDNAPPSCGFWFFAIHLLPGSPQEQYDLFCS